MKKTLAALTILGCLSGVCAEDDGGEIVRWPENPGLFVFANAQKRVPSAVFEKPISDLADEFRIDIRTKVVADGAADIRKIAGYLANWGAKGGIFIIDDETLPVVIAAPENEWGVLNIAPLVGDGASGDKLARRVRKYINRLFAGIHGIADPVMMPACVTKNAVDMAAVDALVCDTYSPEAEMKVNSFLSEKGYKQKHSGTYLDACEEGWAPAPTNAVQKAIWDKVHALPTKPIKILPKNARDAKK